MVREAWNKQLIVGDMLVIIKMSYTIKLNKMNYNNYMYFDWFRYCTNRYRKYKRSAALEIDIEFKRLSAILREEL